MIEHITIPNMSESDVKRFWGKVGFTANPDKCWEWMGIKRRRGYGSINLTIRRGKNVPFVATRIAFYLQNNIDPMDSLVLHSCDNPSCVNPNHLSLGDRRKNAMEMMERSRGKMQFEKGEKHPSSKLTEIQVLEIREKYAKGFKQKELGVEYNVDQSQISYIITRKLWANLL